MNDNPLLQLIASIQAPARTTKLNVEIALKLREAGLSNRAIARRFGVSHQAVSQRLPPAPAWRHSQETKDKYFELRAAGMSVRRAAIEMGLCRSTVEKWEKTRWT